MVSSVKSAVKSYLDSRKLPRTEPRLLRDPKHACLQNLSDQMVRQYGLFALEDVKAGDLICEYAGVVGREAPDAWCNDNYGEYSFQLQALDHHVKKNEGLYACAFLLDAATHFNEAALVNDVRSSHEFDEANGDSLPTQHENTTLQTQHENTTYVEVLVNGWPHAFLVAAEDVAKDQEFFVDYMDEYWQKIGNRMRDQQIKGLKRRITELERELVKLRIGANV